MDNEDISLNITKRLPILIICFIGEVILVALTLYAKILLNVQDHTFFCYSAIYGLGLGVFILVTWWKKGMNSLFFPMHRGSFFLFSIVEAEKDPLFPFHFVCFLCLFVSQSFQLRPSSSWATEWMSDCLKVSNVLRDWATFDWMRRRVLPMPRQIDPHWHQGIREGEIWGMLTFIMKKIIL